MPTIQCFAADEAPEFYYELSIDGEDTKEVRPGDIITVTLHLHRTDYDGPYTMYAMQNEIRYDSEFFKLVKDSALLASGIQSIDIGLVDNHREFYMNYVSLSGGKQWNAKTRVGSFQLEVIAESGVTNITNEDYLVSLRDGTGSYYCEANHLTVIVSTDCIVRFQTNGGSNIDDVKAIYGEIMERPQDPVREGKRLVGWYKDIHLTKEWNFASDLVSGNMTLYAKWEDAKDDNPVVPDTPVKYTVRFDSNGGSKIDDVTAVYGELLERPKDPIREAKYLVGWYKDFNLTKEWDFANDIVNGDMTLYAKWEDVKDDTPVKYTVRFDSNGGTGTMADQTFTVGTSATLLPNSFTYEAYDFAGWEDFDGNPYADKATVLNLTKEDGGVVTLRAQWIPHEYSVVFKDENGKTIDTQTYTIIDKTITEPPVPEKEGYTGRWGYYNLNVLGDKVIKPVYTAIRNSLKLDAAGGTMSFDPSGDHYADGSEIILPEPVRDGYIFMGWTDGKQIYSAGEAITISGIIKLEAFWAKADNSWPPEYSVDSLITDRHINYVVGYPDGTILPMNNITRAEVAVIFYRLLTDEFLSQYETTTNSFTDVRDRMWYNKAISTLSNAGILTGYPDGKFHPENNITRAELAAIIDRLAEAESGKPAFNDVRGHWAYESIGTAQANGWINGYPDGSFRPNRNITRAETFAVVNRLLGRFVNNVSCLHPDMQTFKDNMKTGAWYYFDIQEATNNHQYTRFDGSKYEKWTELLENIHY